jgi:hypothetical protein
MNACTGCWGIARMKQFRERNLSHYDEFGSGDRYAATA